MHPGWDLGAHMCSDRGTIGCERKGYQENFKEWQNKSHNVVNPMLKAENLN